MLEIIKNNPAAVIGALRALVIAILGVLVTFGIHVSPEQQTALIEMTGALVTISLLFSAATHLATVPKEPTPDAPAKSIQVLPPTTPPTP